MSNDPISNYITLTNDNVWIRFLSVNSFTINSWINLKHWIFKTIIKYYVKNSSFIFIIYIYYIFNIYYIGYE